MLAASLLLFGSCWMCYGLRRAAICELVQLLLCVATHVVRALALGSGRGNIAGPSEAVCWCRVLWDGRRLLAEARERAGWHEQMTRGELSEHLQVCHTPASGTSEGVAMHVASP